MEELKKLIEGLEKDRDKVLCFFGFNDGKRRAERLYICYNSNINLYSHLLPYEPLLDKMVKVGRTTWEEIEEALEKKESNYEVTLNTVRLIHSEYPSVGFDTDHGAQVVKFYTFDDFMNDVSAIDRGKIGHCMLANPRCPYFDHHQILTKEQMFKDALYFCQDWEEWKFLFEWGDNVGEKCEQYTPKSPKIMKPKDYDYYNLREQKRLMERILELDPENDIKEELVKVEEELKEYEE